MTSATDGLRRRLGGPSGGNRVAITLGVVAVLIAGTGTAVAVTAARTSLVDPKYPSRVVRVDSRGHLAVTGPVSVSGPVAVVGSTSTLATTLTVPTPAAGASTNLTSPTTATLAITEVSVGDPHGNAAATNANYTVLLEKHGTDASGQCVRGAPALLARYDIAPGDWRNDVPSRPLVVGPTGKQKYCLALFAYTSNGSADTGPYFAYADFTAYVARGTYTGMGQLGTAGAPLAARQLRKPAR